MAISGGDAILGRAAVLLGAEVDPNFGREAEKGMLGPLQGIARKISGILVGAFAAHELFKFFKESTAAAIENQKSIVVLTTTLANLGLSDATEDTEKFIKKLSEERGIIEDVLRPAFVRLVGFTHDAQKAQDLLSLAQNISAATGKDLTAVAIALGKATGGTVTGLARMGINIKDASGHVLPLTQLLAQLTTQYEGLGEKVANIDPFQKFNVAMHELKVQVGDLLLPVLGQIGRVLKDDLLPPIRSVIGVIGDLNGMTDGWAGKIVFAAASLATLAFAVQKIITLGLALKLFLATTISQLGTGAAVAASYAGGLLGTAEANVVAGGAAGGAAGAFEAEQLSLFNVVPAAEATQLSLFGVAEAETVAAAGATAMGASLLGTLGPIGLLVGGAYLLGRKLDQIFPEGDSHISKAVKEIVKDMQSLPAEAFAAELQKAADRLDDLGYHPFEELRADFDEILKKTPQLAQHFLDVAASLKGGAEGTKGWQAEIDKTVAAIQKVNKESADWQATIDGTGDALDGIVDPLEEVVTLTYEQTAALANAALASDQYAASIEAGKKANEEHAAAFGALVDAIGPYSAAIEAAGGLTNEQMTDMAAAAVQFASDFAGALHDAADPLAFFGDQADITAEQLKGFLDQSLVATQAWAQDLQYAVAIGIDKGFIEELARAGPKSEPILRATLQLAANSSVEVTNTLLTGTRNVSTISHNIWSGMSLDATLAARSMIHSVQDIFSWLGALSSATAAALKGPTTGPLVTLPTLDSVGVPKIDTGGGGSRIDTKAVNAATDAVADSLKRLQDQFKIGEITEQQLADQAGAMWAQTEKFSTSWMAIWEILNNNATHIQDASDKAGKAAQDAADAAAKAAQEAADKAAKVAADAAEKIAEAAAKAAEEYSAAFDEVAAVLGRYGAAVLKARGLSTDQLKVMAADVKSFQQAVASSFNAAASAVAAFGNQTEVTGQQLLDFQLQSLQDARDWSGNITRLMQMGLDASLLRPLAEAGPKAGALVKAYLDEIGLVGVDAVNQIARDQARVLSSTSASLSGAIAGVSGGGFGGQTVNSMFTVQGSVYGVADLNAYMDQRDAQLAMTLQAGQR